MLIGSFVSYVGFSRHLWGNADWFLFFLLILGFSRPSRGDADWLIGSCSSFLCGFFPTLMG